MATIIISNLTNQQAAEAANWLQLRGCDDLIRFLTDRIGAENVPALSPPTESIADSYICEATQPVPEPPTDDQQTTPADSPAEA